MSVLCRKGILPLALLVALFANPVSSWVLNNPYPASDAHKKIYYSSFKEQPKTLDPARSYSSNEFQIIAQTYEPVLQYDYYARPYKLQPQIALSPPNVRYLDKNHVPMADNKGDVGYTVYTVRIKSGILFQPHPAFATDEHHSYRYLHLSEDFLDDEGISQLSDFKYTGTRELLADDYLYQIKRLANPAINSPIYGLLGEHIVGFSEFGKKLPATHKEGEFVDLRNYPLEGIRKLGDYAFEITLSGQYPQFMFWLAMPFFSPIPWEADKFYSQAGMDDKNISFDWYPVGTGAFMLSENNPNRRMILDKNPNYRLEYFPANGSKEDIDAGYMQKIGHLIPMIDRVIYTLEKESIPRWNKFLQGYYDLSGISTDSYDQAIKLGANGEAELTQSMQEKKMHLEETIDPGFYYLGFNMLDSVVGGNSEKARKLRQAISIAVNFDEHISIFYNGRGKAAQGPLPPGIFGFKDGAEGINPYVYQWKNNKAHRRSLIYARQLMKEAGYPGGYDPKTRSSLILHYDVSVNGGPDEKSILDWMRKQFASIGIDLDVRSTQYNRFQEKLRNGNAQIFSWSWSADYPDPENFLFLLYGANAKVAHGGENSSNYANPEYDRLFELMKNRENDAQRQQLIDKMVEILRHDAPLVWGINTQSLFLSQQWVSLTKPNTLSLNSLKYISVDVETRNKLREAWNKPVLWPVGLLLLLILLIGLPLIFVWRKKENATAVRVTL